MLCSSRIVRWPLRELLVLALLSLLNTSTALAAVLGVDVVHEGVVLENGEAVTFSISGANGDPCFDVSADPTGTGLVEPNLIRVRFEVAQQPPKCIQVVTDYAFDQEFPEGFAAGSYKVEVIERRWITPDVFVDSVFQFDLMVGHDDSFTPTVSENFGAVKALYSSF